MRKYDCSDQTQHHQCEVLGGAEFEGQFGQRRGKGCEQEGRDRASKEGTDGGDAQRGARATLPCHLIAVERGHDRRRLTRQVDQNCGGGTAVLGAVINAREHDQGTGRVRHLVGGGQQHRDRCEWPDPGEHADERTENDSNQTDQQVCRGGRSRESKSQV